MEYIQAEGWDKVGFQERLLAWFKQKARDFPWRHTNDPYAVLVAEKLLQQTQARDRVVLAYQTLISNYPTPEALATADITDLEEIVRPLGFKYRAVELKTMASEIVERYGGHIPADLKSLMSLTGVGSYGARAVLSFVYGGDVPVVDTNVARILYRVFGIAGPLPANPARRRSLIELAGSLLPPGPSREFNLAILDLGALICTPISPNCSECPVRPYCVFGQKQLMLD